MVEIAKDWEICIACGCTSNERGDNYCRECGYEIEDNGEE